LNVTELIKVFYINSTQNAPMGLLERLQKHIDGLRKQKSPAVDVEEHVVELSLETHAEIPSGDQLVEEEKEPVGGAKEVEYGNGNQSSEF
jgi:hypothetical protein